MDPVTRHRLHTAIAISFLILAEFLVPPACADLGDSEILPDQTNLARIDQLERVVAELQLEIGALRDEAAFRSTVSPSPIAAADCDANASYPSHYITYDDGWALRPHDTVRSPYELKFNIHNQFRFTNLATTSDSFEDAAGNVHPTPSRNDFDVNRGRFVVSGYAFNPQLRFYTNIDYNTVSTRPVQLLLSWISYRFSDALELGMGLGKVPGTWEWNETSRFTLGTERTMATTFFRPSITAGVWAEGRLGEHVHYHALVGDGFNTFSLRAAELDTNLAFSTLAWWEPFDGFGPGFSDLEHHQSLSLRIGHGFTFASNDSDPIGEPGPEQTVIRLSDGTRLVETGALAPGVTVNAFDISLYTVHLGVKRRGVSFAAEYFLRWLTSIEGNGALPVNSLFDHGFFTQGGIFVIPQRLEVYGVGSYVQGDFGSGSEFGAGVNWYVDGRRGNRLTVEATRLDDSPAQQDRTAFVAGSSGTLIRVQWWHFF